ncbi:MAG: hypothetical protein WKH64_05325 [Chloroflexia bacterium]
MFSPQTRTFVAGLLATVALCIATSACSQVRPAGEAVVAPTPVAANPGPATLELHEEARELPGKLALSVGGSIWSFSGGEWSRLTQGKSDVQPAWNRRTGRLYFIRRSADHSDVHARHEATFGG